MFARNQTNYNNPFQRVGITHNELEILTQLMTPFYSYLNILAILDFVYIIVSRSIESIIIPLFS